MTGMKVAQALEHAKEQRGSLPESIAVDNGTEFSSRALEAWQWGMMYGYASFDRAAPWKMGSSRALTVDCETNF